MISGLSRIAIGAALMGAVAAESASTEYERRVRVVRNTPGLVAFWDFVKRQDGRFAAYQAKGDQHDFRLDAVNYVREYWNVGRTATYADFQLLGRGPFGQAVLLRAESDVDFRPLLMVPRERLHNSGLDAKGPGQSVSMVVWLIHQRGDHALAGIWHEGTDLRRRTAGPAPRAERGRRQYALFAGLAGNPGGVAAHVSENGVSSFGDWYARNLAVTPEVMPAMRVEADAAATDGAWCVAGFSFDDRRHTLTAYLNGKATDYWIEHLEEHPFYKWAYNGWQQAELRRRPGLQPGEDPLFPVAQFYQPPEVKPLSRTLIQERGEERVELQVFPFTKVRVTLRKGTREPVKRELVALRVNPFWFGHDLYAPLVPEEGGPFTIGRVIHSGRSVGWTGYIGGVAVFRRPLSRHEMERLAAIALTPIRCPE